MTNSGLFDESVIKSGFTLKKTSIAGICVDWFGISESRSKALGETAGNYITLQCDAYNAEAEITALSSVLSELLSVMECSALRTLVAGIGNSNVISDSLGVKAAKKVLATAHFTQLREFAGLGLREVCVIEPGIKASTGIETARLLKYIADGVNPDCIIVIDSLSCSNRQKLARTIQITDTEISPGIVNRIYSMEISRKTFGIPIIAIGVPTVMEMAKERKNSKPSFITPYNIDNVISHFSRVISSAINNTLNPALDKDDVEFLLTV